MYSTKPSKRPKKSMPRYAIFSTLVIGALLVVGGVLLFVHHKQPATQNASVTNKSNATNATARLPAQASQNTSSNTGSDGSAKGSDNPPPAAGAAPKTPSGDFVSNHQPSMNGGDWQLNHETSVCNTSPGASCSITFTNGSTTKSLSAKQADSGGAVYWTDWTLQDVGLSAGTWTIAATATLNGQTASASDPIKLQVQP